LVLRLVYAFPDLIKRLEAQQVSIHRPWATWADFAKGAVRVLELQRQEQAKARAAQAQTASAEAAAASDPANDQTQQLPDAQGAEVVPQPAPRSAVKSGPRVISIGNKPAARPAAKAASAPANMPVKVSKAAELPAPDAAAKPPKVATKAASKPSKVAIANR
jgi:hypothetical protein